MGICGSSGDSSPEDKEAQRVAQKKTKALEKAMQEENNLQSQISKLLLLGAGESGKSTLFKQMITIYGNGFPESERKTFEAIIYNNIITSALVLLEKIDEFGGPGASAIKTGESGTIVCNLQGNEKIDEALADHIAVLWKSEPMQLTYDKRSKFQLTDSAPYFFNRIAEVGKDDYIPTEQDVLRSRVRTTGIVENDFTIEGNNFKMFDVGGQRNERKKWIHCFENVTAVLFVGVLSEYDLVLYEDETQNRMEETLNLFEEIINSRWFRDTSVILFLNKRDLFAEKIQTIPLSTNCPVFIGKGPEFYQNFSDNTIDNYDNGAAAIQEEFEHRNTKNGENEKTIYTHVTCATDTGNVHAVFDAVKDIIIRQSLGDAGLV